MKLNTARRTLALCSAAALVLGLSACATPAPTPVSLAETVARTPQLSTFSQLIEQAGLKAELNAAGPLTVFAPSNEAFKAVPAKTMEALNQNPAQLKAVLSYHLVAGKLAAADIKNANVATLNGANVATARAGSFVTIEDALVQDGELSASNGVVHVIDRVLTPPKK